MNNVKARSNLKVIWENNLPLDKVKWNKISLNEFSLPKRFHPKIKSYWTKHLEKNPKDYDGKLLFLNNYKIENKVMLLDVGYIRFSTVIFMVKNHLCVEQGIGMLGTQCLVFSPCKQYVLLGERSLTQTYYPGATTIPGGILEIDDLDKEPCKALLREVNEEVPLPLNSDAYLKAILVGWNGVSVTFLLCTSVSNSYNFNPFESISGEKSEWENNLRWISLEKLREFPSNYLLDGLIYFKSKIKNSL